MYSSKSLPNRVAIVQCDTYTNVVPDLFFDTITVENTNSDRDSDAVLQPQSHSNAFSYACTQLRKALK